MKIAYIVGGLPFGGVETWLYDLAAEYRSNGLVEARIFNLSGTGDMRGRFVEQGLDVQSVATNTHAIASHRLDTTLRLRAMLRDYAPDVIHTMHISANHHGRLAALGLGVPVVTHLHNVKREKRLHRRLSDKLLSHATTAYLAVSQAVADVLAADHNVAGRPVRVFYNAIDPKRCDMPPLDLKAAFGVSGPVILSVGRYVRQKNLDLLIRAVRLLHDQHMPASLVLVGEGVERPRLEALRDSLGLGGHVVLTGFRQDVAAFFRAADVFAMPSDFEGFPIAQMEALYCGLPCVVSRHVPSLEVASDASLVCETEPGDIAAKLLAVLRDDTLRVRLSEAARRVAEPLTMPHYAMRLHSFYTELLAGNLR